jgi:transcriptional regulator with XRE-family HTH domain
MLGGRTETEMVWSRLFGRNLRHLRNHRKMSLNELAKQLRNMGLKAAQGPLSLLERGVRYSNQRTVSANVHLLLGCAKVLRVKPEWFLTEHENIFEALPKNFEIIRTESLSSESIDPALANLGPNVLELRLKPGRGWTQEELAEKVRERVRMSVVRICQIENGYKKNRYVTVDQLMALAEVLESTVDMFFRKPRVHSF